jgi:hypothetical protein
VNDHPRTKTAQVNLRLQPDLKAAAEKAAANDHRSLTSLFEMLLTEYLRRKGYLGTPEGSHAARRQGMGTVREASSRQKAHVASSKLAERELESLGDKAAPAPEQERRKRHLIKGPKEFRQMRENQRKPKG